MQAALTRIFSPPVFNDEKKDFQAALLNIILWAFIILPFPYFFATLMFSSTSLMRVSIICVVGETINLVLYILLRKGYVFLASAAQVSALWLLISTLAFTSYGVRGMAYLLGYALVIMVAGSLLGSRGALIFTTLSIVSGGIMLFLEARGFLSFPEIGPSIDYWIVSAVLFPVGAVLQYISSSSLNRALQRARASEAQFRSIVETIPDAIYISDSTGRFLEANQSACTQTGYTRQQLLGMQVRQVVSGLFQPQAAARLHRMGSETGFVESIHVRKDGSEIPVELAVLRIEYRGQPAMLAMARDITSRKQIEAERESLISELEAKNAELERFTYTVSHDLKSPLITIRGFIGLLERDLQRNQLERVHSDLNRIAEATDRMQLLLDDLLELSRIGRLMNPSQSLPVSELIQQALEQVAGRLAQNRVQVRLAPGFPVTWGDRARLVEVFQNLVDNAARFMGDQPAPLIEIGQCACTEPGKICLFVRDNGIGIDPRYHDRIFGLFDKLDPTSDGTGIGLALVKRIVEVHGGRIWVESQPGQGAAFYFTLPAPPVSAD